MYETFKVECPHCHSDDIVVIEATHSQTGGRLHFVSELHADGFEVPVTDDMDGSTEDEVARCGACKREFPLAELLVD